MTKRNATLVLAAAAMVTLAACHKKPVAQTPPPPPPPPPVQVEKPAISFFNAEPSSIDKGQGSSLRWSVTNATNISLDQGIGQVSPNGRRTVYPGETTTYTLTASNEGGESTTATATVTVNTPPPVEQPAPQPVQSAADMLAGQVKDIYFDYDKDDIRDDQQATLQGNATALKQIFAAHPEFMVVIEGNCDERGSAEYNLALGDRRASKAKEALVSLGVPADKMRTISYGKERPVCTDQSEECYQRNRHDHFAAAQ
ncbi:MAG TPA: OmpA family protein [Bryobacteraceae bacterium]|jgi:peptidoglycan-associated lipoprotein|nr:OmpA family protein [Bryobacteraceae bacterium]